MYFWKIEFLFLEDSNYTGVCKYCGEHKTLRCLSKIRLDYTLRCLENICSVSSSCFRKYVVCHVFKRCITAVNCILLSMHLFQTMLKQNQSYCCTNIGCTSCVNLSYVSRKYHKRSIGGICIALRIMYICK